VRVCQSSISAPRLRRREKVIRIFPNIDSAWRLIRALLSEYHEEWRGFRPGSTGISALELQQNRDFRGTRDWLGEWAEKFRELLATEASSSELAREILWRIDELEDEARERMKRD